jgi:hypothetical protein
MTDMLTIAADPKATIPIDLVGVRYEVKPPKAALALRIAVEAKQAGDDPELVLSAIGTWVRMAFGEEDGRKVMARLEDADDDLDFPHVMILMDALIKRVTGNPPTSPSA